MRTTLFSSLAVIALTCGIHGIAQAGDPTVDAIREQALPTIEKLAASPDVISAIKAQNQSTDGYDDSRITALDQQWRTETAATSKPLIDAVLEHPLTDHLHSFQQEGAGLFSEVIVMDIKGLNVALSDVTSDYWQGDEAKWQKTAGTGHDEQFIDEVEFDESSQTFQSQVSVSVIDPDTGAAIGAITVGVVVDEL